MSLRELKYKQYWYGGNTTNEVINIPDNMVLIQTPQEYSNSKYIYENAEHYCGICKLNDNENIIDDIGGDIYCDIALCDWNNIILSDDCKDLVVTPEKAAELFNLSDYYIVRFQHNGAFEGIYNITKIYNTFNIETNVVSNVMMNKKFTDKTSPKDIQYNYIVDIYRLTKNFITDKNYFATICDAKKNPYVKKLFENLIDYVVYISIKKNTGYKYLLYNVDYCFQDIDDITLKILYSKLVLNNFDYLKLIKEFPVIEIE